jgi:hypothetical protein
VKVAVVVVVVAIVASGGYVAYVAVLGGTTTAHDSSTNSSFSSFTATPSATASSYLLPTSASEVSPHGLELGVEINASSAFQAGDSLNISVYLSNAHTSPINITEPSSIPYNVSDFIVNGLPIAMLPGCIIGAHVDFMIVKGNYSVQELGTMSENSSVANGITCMEADFVTHLYFAPSSDLANLTGIYEGGVDAPFNQQFSLFSNFTVNG